MFLVSPEQTPYDLRFRLLGIPVRVHPLFWLVMLLISGCSDNLKLGLVFVACGFVSVLVHEFGHGLAHRATGGRSPGIVLYAMGGFCMMDSRPQRPGERLFVLLMGPGAGLLLLAVVLAAARIMYGIHPADALALFSDGSGPIAVGIRHVLELIGLGGGDFAIAYFKLPPSLPIRAGFEFLLYINLLWGILNLLPIWPLDGGQSTEVILEQVDPRHARRWTHVVSLLTAGGIALYWATRNQYMLALWFGYFAFMNYQSLQALHYSSFSSRADDSWRH
jgi:stage IV sporulation protein FB